MRISNKWYDSIFLRTLLDWTGARSSYAGKEYVFPAYFQYSIGPYQQGYRLYFPKRPSKQLYKYEIFTKMEEYTGDDLIRFLEFHYAAYDDKKDFLHFLRYEVLQRMKYHASGFFYHSLERVLEWGEEQEKELLRENGAGIGQTHTRIRNGDRPAVIDSGNGLSSADSTSAPQRAELTEQHIQLLLQDERVLAIIENAVKSIADSYSGRISLNNQANMEKVIQVLILLQETTAPNSKTEYLFNHFTQTDIAAILHQCDEFSDKRMNTIQLKVGDASKSLERKDPKAVALARALQDFFYSSSSK